MADETPILTRVYVTANPLELGRIVEANAEIQGDMISFAIDTGRCCMAGEGRNWHRTRWAAQNYACQLRDARLREVTAEKDRLERMDFGLKR